MHTKHIHEMIEKLSDCTKQAIENNDVCVGQYPISDCVDMIKDLCEAEYHAKIVKAMDKAEEDEKEEEKYILRKLKEEMDGDEEKAKRFYDDWRYMRSGRFAPRGKGTRTGRRGFDEPPYWHMNPEMHDDFDPEHYRDMDKNTGHLYYTESGNRRNYGNYNSVARNNSNMNGDMSDTRNYGGSRKNETRYERARRGFEEAKMTHGNTADGKQLTMKEAEKFTDVALDELFESLDDASPEVKAMVKTKAMNRIQKM